MNLPRFLLGAVLAAASASVYAADGGVEKAAKLLEKHYYESAAAELRAVGGELPPVAALTLARAYAGNAQLYRALQQSSLGVGVSYLKKLAKQRRDRSRYVSLYLGEYYAAAGNAKAGASQLRRFVGEKRVLPAYRDSAKVELAMFQGSSLQRPPSSDPLVSSSFAAALSVKPARRGDAVKQMDQALAKLAKPGDALPVKAVTNAIAVYARSGETAKAFDLLHRADLSLPSYEESIGKSKVLRFYDPALLGNLADLNSAAGEAVLKHVRANEKYKAVAGYFLADLYMNNNQFRDAAPLLKELQSGAGLPAAYRDRALLLQAALNVRTGKAKQGNMAIAGLTRKYAHDPVMLAEVLSTCVRFKGRCRGVAGIARNLAATSQGERFRNLHFAVGEELASRRSYSGALQEMETARDKSNKNRIDTNDPMLLVRLADMYFATKGFSEALEIYFEMSREFPAVRQLQEAGQGVYSTEFRSAGDAKIF